MELNGVIPLLRRWFAVMALATAVAMLVGWWLSSASDETYEARSVVLVGPLNTDSDTMRASSALAQTYAELATSTSLLTRVSATTDVPKRELSDGVRATANGTTRFLTIRARADNRVAARDVANAITEDLVRLSQEGAVRPEGQLRVIDPAAIPSTPVSPRSDLVVPLAALAGLLGSAAMILLFEFVSDSAESAAKVGEAAGVTTLAVPRRRSRRTRAGRRRPDPLRVVATQVELASPALRCVVVTSATDDDGAADVALDLACIWAERHPQVTVLDATGESLRLWGEPASPDAPPTASVTEKAATDMIAILAAGEQLVVVVTPSPVTSAATLVWAHVADVTLLAVRRFQTRRAQVRDAASNLRATEANVPFVVLHEGGRQSPDAPPRRHQVDVHGLEPPIPPAPTAAPTNGESGHDTVAPSKAARR